MATNQLNPLSEYKDSYIMALFDTIKRVYGTVPNNLHKEMIRRFRKIYDKKTRSVINVKKRARAYKKKPLSEYTDSSLLGLYYAMRVVFGTTLDNVDEEMKRRFPDKYNPETRIYSVKKTTSKAENKKVKSGRVYTHKPLSEMAPATIQNLYYAEKKKPGKQAIKYMNK